MFLATAPGMAAPVAHWTQPSGVQVFWVPSPSIPMVDVRIEFDAGDRRDPVGKAGLANTMAASLSNGVRATAHEPALDENALGEAWADVGASFSAVASADRLSFSLRSLTEPELLAKAVTLAARQMAQPAFPVAVWQRDRPKWIAALKEADTRPATQVARAFERAVFGAHPYGAETTPASLMRIKVQDMVALHGQAVRPCYAKVSVVGALDRAQTDALVAQLIERLPTSVCPGLPALAEVPPLQRAQEQDIAFASAQAHVLLGQPGYARSDPDHLALLVGNHILGGGAESRLTQEIREKRGLTYSVDSSFAPGLQAGAFAISLQTRADQAHQALQLARELLKTFVEDGPSEAELQDAKDHLIGSFPLLLDGNLKLLDNVANIAWYDLPLDYLDQWTAEVQQLTVGEIRAAFARKLQPDRMVTVVLGAASPR
jgi:zinc protease